MNNKILLLVILLLASITFSSFKQPKLNGLWRFNATAYDVRDSNNVKFVFWTDEFQFIDDSNGIRKKTLEQKRTNAQREIREGGFVIKYKFKYRVLHNDTGYLMTIEYDAGQIDRTGTEDSITVLKIGFDELHKLSITTQKFYFKIRPDSKNNDRISLQYMEPGTNKMNKFAQVTENTEEQLEKRVDKTVKKTQKRRAKSNATN